MAVVAIMQALAATAWAQPFPDSLRPAQAPLSPRAAHPAANDAVATASPPQSVIVLRNGQTMEGRVVTMGDFYQVYLPDGELRLRAAEVEFVCRDLEEGYQRKQAALPPGNIQAHLELAQWCQRHNLLGCAAKELSAAMDIDPAHPMIAVLQRRLKAAAEKPDPPPPHLEPVKKVPSAEELDRMVRGMPPGAVESFAQLVQPILMNHCMTGGCHGPQANSRLELMRAPLGQPPSRRVTQRNLHAVLEWIDRDNPGASKLLAAARGPHGPAKTAVFNDRQVLQYRRLLEWVYLVGQRSPPDGAPEVFAESQKPWGGGSDDSAPRVLPSKTTRAKPMPRQDRHANSGGVRSASASGSDEPAVRSKPGKRSGASSGGQQGGKADQAPPRQADPPGDPFDPELFNRQFAPPSNAPPEPAPPAALPTPAAKALQGTVE